MKGMFMYFYESTRHSHKLHEHYRLLFVCKLVFHCGYLLLRCFVREISCNENSV